MTHNGSNCQLKGLIQVLAPFTTLGRVAVTMDALPAIFPVDFPLVGDEIVFLTGEGTKLSAARLGKVVAFEADWADKGRSRPGTCWW